MKPSSLGARRGAARVAAGALIVVLVVLAAFEWTPRPTGPTGDLSRAAPRVGADAATVARGAYVARLGNCASCHTLRGGRPYAGGRAIPTPFGTVYSGNLTPDNATGLGRWTPEDFWRAVHLGRSRDGHLLAPAFPYTEFTRLSREDSDALYAYLRTLPAVTQAQPASGLRFPYNTQTALAVWRALYFRESDPQDVDATDRSEAWLRGAYLVRGPGHCAACHAPRSALGGTREAGLLAGGTVPMQPWYAPSLAPVSGVPPEAQRQAIVELLRSGMGPHGSASGPMAEVVIGSTQYWSDADLQATAIYLTSLPVRPLPRAEHGTADSDTGAATMRGNRIYTKLCADCHGARGEGAPGIYPALAGNTSVTLPTPDNLLEIIRHGGFAPATVAGPRPYGMPPSDLAAQDLADLATYVRQAWGNTAAPVSVLDASR